MFTQHHSKMKEFCHSEEAFTLNFGNLKSSKFGKLNSKIVKTHFSEISYKWRIMCTKKPSLNPVWCESWPLLNTNDFYGK